MGFNLLFDAISTYKLIKFCLFLAILLAILTANLTILSSFQG